MKHLVGQVPGSPPYERVPYRHFWDAAIVKGLPETGGPEPTGCTSSRQAAVAPLGAPRRGGGTEAGLRAGDQRATQRDGAHSGEDESEIATGGGELWRTGPGGATGAPARCCTTAGRVGVALGDAACLTVR